MSEEIVEIRDYTIEADSYDAYLRWAEADAVPWLNANLDLVDFWVHDGHEAEVGGSSPFESPNGQANVCWIIRWPSRAVRNEGFKAFVNDPGWQEVWKKHPNPNAYLQANVRFMRTAIASS